MNWYTHCRSHRRRRKKKKEYNIWKNMVWKFPKFDEIFKKLYAFQVRWSLLGLLAKIKCSIQVQWTQRPILRHIIIKHSKDKERDLRAERGKWVIPYKESSIKLLTDFLTQPLEARSQGSIYLNW